MAGVPSHFIEVLFSIVGQTTSAVLMVRDTNNTISPVRLSSCGPRAVDREAFVRYAVGCGKVLMLIAL